MTRFKKGLKKMVEERTVTAREALVRWSMRGIFTGETGDGVWDGVWGKYDRSAEMRTALINGYITSKKDLGVLVVRATRVGCLAVSSLTSRCICSSSMANNVGSSGKTSTLPSSAIMPGGGGASRSSDSLDILMCEGPK